MKVSIQDTPKTFKPYQVTITFEEQAEKAAILAVLKDGSAMASNITTKSMVIAIINEIDKGGL